MHRGFIVSQSMELRLRLQQLMTHSGQYSEVDSVQNFEEARMKMSGGGRYDFVFIGDEYEPQDCAEFVEAVRRISGAKKTGLILVMRSDQQSHSAIANNMMIGFHGFLCEPFNVERVQEATSLAKGVLLQDSTVRMKAATGVLLTNMRDADSTMSDDNQEICFWDRVQDSCKWYKSVTGESVTNLVVSMKDLKGAERLNGYDGVSSRVRSFFERQLRKRLAIFKTKSEDEDLVSS